MRRHRTPFVVLILALGLVGGTPPAEATHAGTPIKTEPPHENSPSPPVPQSGGTCVVIGVVDLGDEHRSGGMPIVPQVLGKNHNHFKFQETVTECIGGPAQGAFSVNAAGATDGPGECDGLPGKDPKCHTTNHGEDSAVGWSHSDCYRGDCMMPKAPKDVDDIYSGTNTNPPGGANCYNCGEIIISGPAGRSCQNANSVNPDNETCSNFLKFCRGIYDDEAGDGHGDGLPDQTCSNLAQGGSNASRGGSNALAWGALVNWSHQKALVVCFLADLELTALILEQGHFPPPGKIDRFFVEGVGFTWTAANKADCAGKKNPA